jgi:hypothetical protein
MLIRLHSRHVEFVEMDDHDHLTQALASRPTDPACLLATWLTSRFIETIYCPCPDRKFTILLPPSPPQHHRTASRHRCHLRHVDDQAYRPPNKTIPTHKQYVTPLRLLQQAKREIFPFRSPVKTKRGSPSPSLVLTG